MKVRLARCGHEVPSHPGHQRVGCDACDPDRASRSARRRTRPERPEAIACGVCGKAVLVAARGHVPKYCGDRCWRSARNPAPCGTCGNCGIELNRAGKKYCSTTCGEIARGQRRAVPLPRQTCALPECGVGFLPKHSKQRCCCERHGKMLCNRELRAAGRMPLGDPLRRRRNLRAKTQRRRAAIRGARLIERFMDVEIFERDRWRCGICRRRVNRNLVYPHPRSPSLDHIVPLSQDPNGHTRSNVRCSHLDCNNRRSNRGGNEQLALIG